MQPPRVVIAVAFLGITLFLTYFSVRSSNPPQTITSSTPNPPDAGIKSFFSLFSFQAPFSLFPPNAIITLTHENSTAFLARPAAFGPPLPIDGLKGQVWIGSGFGDDTLRQGSVASSAEGELGCSDVLDRTDGYAKPGVLMAEGTKSGDGKPMAITPRIYRKGNNEDGSFDGQIAEPEAPTFDKNDGSWPSIDDGTDDYLHHPLPESTVTKQTDSELPEANGNHADIQSIQEGAEIAGKVVLLSRGGCGFLEKVKWAQRRGAIALIVGDDTKGGALIQMYARGDTSNVTIPSIFTSRTTAHLLSSLIGPGAITEDSVDGNGNAALKVQHTEKPKKDGRKDKSSPTFTTSKAASRPTATARAGTKPTSKKPSTPTEEKNAAMNTDRPGWIANLLFGSGGSSKSDSSRPPSSGQLDWVLVDDWRDGEKVNTKKAPTSKPTTKPDSGKKIPQKGKASDDFEIGVQDWRDPDLVGPPTNKDGDVALKAAGAKAGETQDLGKTKTDTSLSTKSGKTHIGGAQQDIPEHNQALGGGSITPGSGEYGGKAASDDDKAKANDGSKNSMKADGATTGLLRAFFGDDEEEDGFPISSSSSAMKHVAPVKLEGEEEDGDGDDESEGLWVTLTPTSGASPFLDTILVLVVSPLVTLTVVYALLLVRSRIRRRRWRAPKSVVERLPVRTYQAITTSGSQSPRLPSPTGSSVTTPLLQQATPMRPRPRSRTTTGIPEPGDLIRVNSVPLQVPQIPTRAPDHEKNSSVSSEWKKHMGKQIECVVCLEEYVAGVSRVMSLPCGHEFHVDCITPWLTTRRRTCPICKGDVVRSLARGSPSNPRYDSYHDDSDEDVQIQAAETADTSASSSLSIPRTIEESRADLEQGIASPTPTRPQRVGRNANWRSVLASSFGSASQSPRPAQEDRNR